MAPVPFRGMKWARYSSSMAGIKNASVLPEPGHTEQQHRVMVWSRQAGGDGENGEDGGEQLEK
eukprot:1159315-Pelagomonas_calceolata.AAC.1